MKFFFFKAGSPYQDTHGLFQDAGHYFHHGLAGPISAKEAQKLRAFMGGEIREYNNPDIGPEEFLNVLNNFDVALDAVSQMEDADTSSPKQLLDKNLTLDGTVSTYLSNAPKFPKEPARPKVEEVEEVEEVEGEFNGTPVLIDDVHVDAEDDEDEVEDEELEYEESLVEGGIAVINEGTDTLEQSIQNLKAELESKDESADEGTDNYNEQISEMGEADFDWMEVTKGSRKKKDVARAYKKFRAEKA